MSKQNLTKAEVAEVVRKHVAEHLGRTVDDTDLNKTLIELDADSLDTIEIVMDLEEVFKIELSDAVCAKFETGNDIVVGVFNALQ